MNVTLTTSAAAARANAMPLERLPQAVEDDALTKSMHGERLSEAEVNKLIAQTHARLPATDEDLLFPTLAGRLRDGGRAARRPRSGIGVGRLCGGGGGGSSGAGADGGAGATVAGL